MSDAAVAEPFRAGDDGGVVGLDRSVVFDLDRDGSRNDERFELTARMRSRAAVG